MSRYRIIPLAAAGLLAVYSAAFAAQTATGEIKSVNATKHKLKLTDGHSFKVSKKIDLSQFSKGQKVNVTFEDKNGKPTVSEIAPAQ